VSLAALVVEDVADLLAEGPLTARAIASELLLHTRTAGAALDRLFAAGRVVIVGPRSSGPEHPVVRYALADGNYGSELEMSGAAFGIEEVIDLLERTPMGVAAVARELCITVETAANTVEHLLMTERVVSASGGLYRLSDDVLARRRRLHERMRVAR
jgi:hypothetical protein